MSMTPDRADTEITTFEEMRLLCIHRGDSMDRDRLSLLANQQEITKLQDWLTYYVQGPWWLRVLKACFTPAISGYPRHE